MRAFRRANWGCADVHVAEFCGAEVDVLLTGAGLRQAQSRFGQVVSEAGRSIDLIISSGLAGGLRPEYRVGQVLAAKHVLADGVNNPVASSAHLIKLASECSATGVDAFFSADHVIAAADEKRVLGATANAVEMESFEVLRGAAAMGIPAIAVRAISDALEENHPIDTNRVFTSDGEVSIARVLGELARRPQSIPGLVRLGWQCRFAAKSLAGFLDIYIQKIVGAASPLEPEVAVVRG
jgi:nucleoside phosphorylase